MVGWKRRKYRGVEVIAGDGACDAARSLANLRLLSVDVALLPLTTCDRPATCKCKCKCKYRHFDDRRRKFARRVQHALMAAQGAERRQRRGRRESDYA